MPAPTASTPVDVVDERDTPVGTLPRGRVLAAGANFRTVHVLVVDHHGRLLLQRLAATRARHRGRWGSSVAGYLHTGEGYERAARRRLLEELGVEEQISPVGVTRLVDGRSTKFVGVFTCEARSVRNAAPDQIDELRFFELEAIDEHLADTPEEFTPTFRAVYRFWRSQG